MSAETIEANGSQLHAQLPEVRQQARLEGGRCCTCRVQDSEREATILLGEKIKANSWVVGVKVFADHIWQRVQSREYQSLQYRGARFACPKSSIWMRWK
ncbi:MAG: hypothetical protein NTW84_03355 [Methanothrix sp.]|nr:hypothetical protein [Methanothrix sp.]